MQSSHNHPTAYVLDAFSVDALPADVLAATRQHIEACATCALEVQQRRADHHALMERLPPREFINNITLREPLTRAKVISLQRFKQAWVPLALAASVLLALPFASRVTGPQEDHILTMGNAAPQVRVVLRRASGVLEDVQSGTTVQVQPGDAIRVQVTVDKTSYVGLYQSETGEAAQLLGEPNKINAGQWTQPNSFEFDATSKLTFGVAIAPSADIATADKFVWSATFVSR
jgi:hypothetical protein